MNLRRSVEHLERSSSSLSAAFALMFFYWTHLNMFQTIRYLALVAIPLFIFGHRLLATLAARR